MKREAHISKSIHVVVAAAQLKIRRLELIAEEQIRKRSTNLMPVSQRIKRPRKAFLILVNAY